MEPPDAPPPGGSANGFRRADPGAKPVKSVVGRGPPSTAADGRQYPQPRPMNGIVVAMIVMNWTFASSGSPAMNATASAAC